MICTICGFNATTSRGMGSHLHKHNLSAKQYYDLYIRTDNEGICKLDTCNNETPFYGLYKGYQNHCCNSHAQLDKTTQDKIKSTCLKRYGVESSNQSDIVKNKMKHTLIEHYGVDNCQKCKSISDKTIKTRHKNNLEKYGVEEPAKLLEVRNKISKSTREYMLNRSQTEKDNFYYKVREIKRQNGTLSTSKPENDFYEWLLTIFDKQDVFRNYSSDIRYPYMCDFYIKSLDMFIELNLYWMHGFHWFNENNPNDVAKLYKWQEKAKLGHKQYKAAIKVWSNSDVLKHNNAIKNNLNYIVLWNNQDIIQFKQKIEGKIKK